MQTDQEAKQKLAESAALLIREYVPIQKYVPRVYLNGFPKAGLHLLEQLISPLLGASNLGRNGEPWLGSYGYHSWIHEWRDMRPILWKLSRLPDGYYLKGHMGYDQDVANLFRLANIGHIFIYRDPRDVAVSQAYHIHDDNPMLKHGHGDLYRMLGGFDEILSAVIEGLGPYPGVMVRWVDYAPWLETDCMRVRFEDIVADPARWAGEILRYCTHKAVELIDTCEGVDVPEPTYNTLVERMVNAAAKTENSVTFRAGKSGGWREKFTESHKALFKQSDSQNWLIKLGYEQSGEW